MSTTNGRIGRGRQEDTEGNQERRPELAMILNKETEVADGADGVVSSAYQENPWSESLAGHW